MFKYTILALLLVATIQQGYYLSPLYPPTAFEGQYYETRFRVRGLDFPQFNFKGLPDCFKGTSDGVVSGIPKGPGSYSVVITYSSGKQREQKQVVIRISPSLQSDSTFQSAVITSAVRTTSGIILNYPTTLVYSVGANIEFALEAKNGAAPLLWKYNNLPKGVYGDQRGLIKGVFAEPGYYSFSVSCSDSVGISAQAYLTWNIQPKTIIRTSQVVQVRSNYVALQYDIDQVQKQQIAAVDDLFKALELVDKKKQVVQSKKKVVAVATVAANNAQASLDAATKVYNIAVSDRQNAQDRLRVAQNALKATQDNLNLALTEQGNAQQNLVNARSAVADAQKRVAQSQIELSAAEDKLVEAKDRMRASQQKLRTAQTGRQAAKNQYQRAFADLQNARSDLQDAKRRKQLADLSVTNAKDALSIVQQARDDSIAALNKADFALKTAESNLAKVLDKLAYVRTLYVNAKTQYGQAQWNYQTALNKLYIAQARKQTADRASAIALAQGSLSDHNTGYNSTVIGKSTSSVGVASTISHVGCDATTYPPISGTVRVTQKLSNGYKVQTGHQIIFGSCTKQSACNVGDTISYNGYFVNGIVNALRIQRVLLN